MKNFRLIIDSGDIEKAREAFSQVQKNIDKAVTKGILHKRTGARYKSRLSLSMLKSAVN